MSAHGARQEIAMTPRIRNPHGLAPEAIKAMLALEASFVTVGLEPSLRDLVKRSPR